MTSNTKGIDQSPAPRSGASRFFIGLLRFLLLLLFIAAGIFLGYLGWQQFNYINLVNNVQSERISRIDGEMILSSDVERQIRANQQEVNDDIKALQDQLTALAAENRSLQNAVDEQASTIASFEQSSGAIDTTVEDLQSGSEALGNALLALQQDISDTNTNVDSIGAAVDGLTNSVAVINRNIDDLSTTLADVAANPPVVAAEGEDGTPVVISAGPDMAVWRLWGLVMRTKIHLAENDIEAANATLTDAVEAATTLATDGDDDLATVQEQLESAAESLLEKPAAANRTLDEALDALEELLN